MSRPRKRWLYSGATLIAILGNCLVVFCWWHNVWSVQGWRVYRAMEAECHPAWRDYHFGKVRAGDNIDTVIARTSPAKIEKKGRWTFLKYQEIGFTGMFAAAYDGKMVFASASSCCWTRLFFDELTDAQNLELLGRPRDDPKRLGIAPVTR